MTDSTENFIKVDLNLPNHNIELSKAEGQIIKIKSKIESYQKFKNLTDKSHTSLYEEIVRVLDYVGRLSMPAFNIEDELEVMYIQQFKHAPSLAKKLWLDHYDYIHHPYSLLKNRCYRLLEELDKEYIALYDKKPPNWKL